MSYFDILLSGIPQGSILGLILFKIFINYLVLWIKNSDLHNFADSNTISSVANNIEELFNSLQKSSEEAKDWFRINFMIVSPRKSQSITNKNNSFEF